MRPSSLTWLCTSLLAGLPQWSFFCSLTTLVLQERLAPIPRLPILSVWSCSRSLSLKLVCCRLEICNIGPGDCAAVCSRRASACSGPSCESPSGSSVLLMARVESRQFSAQPGSLPETLRHHLDKKFPGCPHFIWDNSRVELERSNSACFSL